jgi:hypothetical protein
MNLFLCTKHVGWKDEKSEEFKEFARLKQIFARDKYNQLVFPCRFFFHDSHDAGEIPECETAFHQ